MEKITTQAPVQVRQDTSEKHERLFSLLIAESLNRAADIHSDTQSVRVDVWNTHSLKNDRDYKNRLDFSTSKKEYTDELIAQRYETLFKSYGIKRDGRIEIRDDDTDFMAIVNQKIARLITMGVLRVEEEQFVYCGDCQQTIAPLVAQIDSCSLCDNNQLETKTKHGLFLPCSADVKKWMLAHTTIGPRGATHSFYSSVATLPAMIQISKQRDNGVRLNDYGVDEDFVLDPKIAIALTQSVIEEMAIGEISTVVLGRNAVKNFVPHAVLLNSSGQKPAYLATGLIPPYGVKDIEERGANFYFPFLALLMTNSASDLKNAQLQADHRLFQKLQRKYRACTEILQKLSQSGLAIQTSRLATSIEPILSAMNEVEMRRAILGFREFIYEDISKDYIEKCKATGKRPDPITISQIKLLYNTLIGSHE